MITQNAIWLPLFFNILIMFLKRDERANFDWNRIGPKANKGIAVLIFEQYEF